jgi:hypothetical protein
METNKKITRQRFNTDPAFERTRENVEEFKNAGKAVKIFKAAFRDVLIVAGDKKITNRLQSQAFRVLTTDPASDRGQRSVAKGDLDILKGFNFNSRNGLNETLFARQSIQIDRASGKVTVSIPQFVPRVRIQASPEATHFQIVAVATAIDFETGKYEYAVQETASLSWDRNTTSPISLELQLPANSKLPIMVALGINFEQAINSKMYPLNSATYNAAAIVEVSAPAP